MVSDPGSSPSRLTSREAPEAEIDDRDLRARSGGARGVPGIRVDGRNPLAVDAERERRVRRPHLLDPRRAGDGRDRAGRNERLGQLTGGRLDHPASRCDGVARVGRRGLDDDPDPSARRVEPVRPGGPESRLRAPLPCSDDDLLELRVEPVVLMDARVRREVGRRLRARVGPRPRDRNETDGRHRTRGDRAQQRSKYLTFPHSKQDPPVPSGRRPSTMDRSLGPVKVNRRPPFEGMRVSGGGRPRSRVHLHLIVRPPAGSPVWTTEATGAAAFPVGAPRFELGTSSPFARPATNWRLTSP